MQNMSSASKTLFLFIIIMLTPNPSGSKILNKDMLQFVGNFLDPDSAQKMKKTSKQWSKVKIYENLFTNEYKMAVFRNVNTKEIIWESIKFNKSWKIPNQEELVSHLRQNDAAKWNGVIEWFDENRFELIDLIELKNLRQNDAAKWNDVIVWFDENLFAFLKELMLAIAKNVAVTFACRDGMSPLMLAAIMDDRDSILMLIKRGADVHKKNGFAGGTALHFAAYYGKINASAALLENKANIDACNSIGSTPLMFAARLRNKNVFEFLIEKGANINLTDYAGQTAVQLADFQ